MKLAKYIRYSTDNQELKVQEDEINKYVEYNIDKNNIEFSKTYSDEGISGKDLKRPKLEEMKNDILEKKIDTVIFQKLDRLSRSVEDLINIFKFFDV